MSYCICIPKHFLALSKVKSARAAHYLLRLNSPGLKDMILKLYYYPSRYIEAIGMIIEFYNWIALNQREDQSISWFRLLAIHFSGAINQMKIH